MAWQIWDRLQFPRSALLHQQLQTQHLLQANLEISPPCNGQNSLFNNCNLMIISSHFPHSNTIHYHYINFLIILRQTTWPFYNLACPKSLQCWTNQYNNPLITQVTMDKRKGTRCRKQKRGLTPEPEKGTCLTIIITIIGNFNYTIMMVIAWMD